jgi:large subunit ribosomal protein L21
VAYAIFRTGGKQFRVSPGEVVRIPSVSGKNAGDTIEFEDVLAADLEGGLRLGAPIVDGARVTATVIRNGRSPKIIVYRYKRRKQYKRTLGHRQGFTEIKIESVS